MAKTDIDDATGVTSQEAEQTERSTQNLMGSLLGAAALLYFRNQQQRRQRLNLVPPLSQSTSKFSQIFKTWGIPGRFQVARKTCRLMKTMSCRQRGAPLRPTKPCTRPIGLSQLLRQLR